MSCPNCSNIIRGADSVDVAALVRDAQKAGDGPLLFCPDCKAGTQSADRPRGMTANDVGRTLAADASSAFYASASDPQFTSGSPAGGGGLAWALTYLPNAGSTVWNASQGAISASGTLSAAGATNPAQALTEINPILQQNNMGPIPAGQLVLPTAAVPVTQGTLSAAQLGAHAQTKHNKTLWIIGGVGLALLVVVYFVTLPPYRKAA